MKDLTTYTFTDGASGDEVCVILRYSEVSVAFTMSLMSNGDVEAVMNKQELSKLIDALTEAKNRIN